MGQTPLFGRSRGWAAQATSAARAAAPAVHRFKVGTAGRVAQWLAAVTRSHGLLPMLRVDGVLAPVAHACAGTNCTQLLRTLPIDPLPSSLPPRIPGLIGC